MKVRRAFSTLLLSLAMAVVVVDPAGAEENVVCVRSVCRTVAAKQTGKSNTSENTGANSSANNKKRSSSNDARRNEDTSQDRDTGDSQAPSSGPSYEELLAATLDHNEAERAKRAASEAKLDNCTDGGLRSILATSCNAPYQPDLMDLPKRPPEGQAPPPVSGAPVPNTAAPPVAPKVTPQEVWVKVKTSLGLDAATPQVGPDFSVHHTRSEVTGKPLDSVVGYPLWFWADGGDLAAKSSTKKSAGMKVSLSMKPGKVTIDPGDGHKFTCSNLGTTWMPSVTPGSKSPTCGYAYQKTGTYTVSMTTQWTVHYVVDDGEGEPLAGDETLSGTRSRTLRIGELQVVNVDG